MKRNKKRGRKSLLNVQLQRKICALLSEGCDQKTACSICGIGERTYHEWKNRGHNGHEPYASFFSAASRARNVFKARLLKIVTDAAEKEARHAEWLLERRWPNEFGRSENRTIVIDRPLPPVVPAEQPSRTTYYWTTKGNEIPFTREQLDYVAQLRSQYPPTSPSKKNGETQP
jgi:hypothetical protein